MTSIVLLKKNEESHIYKYINIYIYTYAHTVLRKYKSCYDISIHTYNSRKECTKCVYICVYTGSSHLSLKAGAQAKPASVDPAVAIRRVG